MGFGPLGPHKHGLESFNAQQAFNDPVARARLEELRARRPGAHEAARKQSRSHIFDDICPAQYSSRRGPTAATIRQLPAGTRTVRQSPHNWMKAERHHEAKRFSVFNLPTERDVGERMQTHPTPSDTKSLSYERSFGRVDGSAVLDAGAEPYDPEHTSRSSMFAAHNASVPHFGHGHEKKHAQDHMGRGLDITGGPDRRVPWALDTDHNPSNELLAGNSEVKAPHYGHGHENKDTADHFGPGMTIRAAPDVPDQDAITSVDDMRAPHIKHGYEAYTGIRH